MSEYRVLVDCLCNYLNTNLCYCWDAKHRRFYIPGIDKDQPLEDRSYSLLHDLSSTGNPQVVMC